MTNVEISIMTYLIIGIVIGGLEIGGPEYIKCELCRNHPILYLIQQIFLWPLFYIIINRVFVLQKIIKILIIFKLIYFIEKGVLYFISQYTETMLSVIITFIVAQFVTLLLFGIFRMPGFGQER